jgi:hypothetical protein
VEKYCRKGQVTDYNMAHAHCMLDISGYKYSHSGCVIRIAIALQQWLHERASMLHTRQHGNFHHPSVYVAKFQKRVSNLGAKVFNMLPFYTKIVR